MSSSVHQAELVRRRRATLGAGGVLLAAAVVYFGWAVARGDERLALLLVGVSALVAGLVELARRGREVLAARALCGVALLAVVAGTVVRGNPGYAPFYMAVGVGLAAVTLPPWDVAVVFVLGIVGEVVVAAVPVRTPMVEAVGGVYAEGALLFCVVGLVAVATSVSVARLVDDLRQRDAEARVADQRADTLARQLEESQRMESLGRLAGGIAHDFNNLLTVVQTCTSLAESQLADGHPARDDLRELDDAVQRGAQLTRQLLACSRRELVRPEVVDLGALVGGMGELLRRLVGRDVDVTIEVPTVPCAVLGGSSELQQVVMNLAVNAGDAMDGRGSLRVTVEVDPDDSSGGACHLRVADTGPGVPAGLRTQIFEPFFSTKGGKGTGLGLSTVYGIVTRLGGRVEVRDRAGGGALFEVTLPLSVDAVEATPVPVRSPTGRRVFVVDDDPQLRRQMCRMLETGGFEVRGFGSAEQVLTDPSLPVPDVLVADVNLGGQTGLSLAEQMTDRNPAVRVVIVSGFVADPTATVRVVRQGAVFLAKPFTPAQLVTAVSEAHPMVRAG